MFNKSIRQAGKTVALATLISFFMGATAFIGKNGHGALLLELLFFSSLLFPL